MAKIITMGEIMLRLSTPLNERFIQADEFDINYGGGEANVAVSLANYGHETEFITAVPDNEIGSCAIAALRKYNVGTHHIARCGERLGIYFLETGSSVRPSQVIYDRAHSSISTATEADFDFNAVFDGADWFHFTGITPAGQPFCLRQRMVGMHLRKGRQRILSFPRIPHSSDRRPCRRG